jgi:hypothetical protein
MLNAASNMPLATFYKPGLAIERGGESYLGPNPNGIRGKKVR